MNAAYCAKSGDNIEEYKGRKRREEELQKEFYKKFPAGWVRWLICKVAPWATGIHLAFWLMIVKFNVYQQLPIISLGSGEMPTRKELIGIDIIFTVGVIGLAYMVRDDQRRQASIEYAQENI